MGRAPSRKLLRVAAAFGTIKQVIETTDTRAGRAFDLGVQLLILFSLVVLCVSTLPDLEAPIRDFLKRVEVTILVLFTVEYVARVLVADRKGAYVRSFYGLVDLVTILPLYLGMVMGTDLTDLMFFRALRFLRILKLARYSATLQRLQSTLRWSGRSAFSWPALS